MVAGEQLPHFTATDVAGRPFAYASIWQRRGLVLVSLPADASGEEAPYLSHLAAAAADFGVYDAALVATRDPVAGAPRPGVVIADRWGEIAAVLPAARVADLPPVSELMEWVSYVQRQCPECQGEAK